MTAKKNKKQKNKTPKNKHKNKTKQNKTKKNKQKNAGDFKCTTPPNFIIPCDLSTLYRVQSEYFPNF